MGWGKWKKLNTEFWKELHHKEALLAQKARISWIQQGDGNTKYFHNAIKYRERRNQIEMLKVGEEWLSEVREIKDEIRRHFQEQFSEEPYNRPTLDGVECKSISEEEARRMTVPFTIEEVEEAITSAKITLELDI